MDGQKSQSKLARTQSSLLRSSPTVRSSIQSLTSLTSATQDQETPDIEEQKPHNNKHGPNPVRTGLAPVLAVLILSLYTVFLFFNHPTSETLLLALTFVAVFLFLVSRNKSMVNQNLVFCKHWCDKCGKRFNLWRFSGPKNSHNRPVQWSIGEPNLKTEGQKGPKVAFEENVEEGVEFYTNGDFYEGEFYQGRCNGSGVYNYFANGRYEGDWIDGRYDGYGIESWSKGSRCKGQYRQGLRHGCGVYKFYTGDSYSGEWCKGQSHGVGIQTCADGSCYVGEFKCGVKHGLGCYHFRNGDRYSGEYFTDKPHGFGIYHFSNGHCYEGSWHEGRKQGYGMYTFSNSESRCGEWDCGVLKTTLLPQNEAIVKAVQAARKTSENVVHIRRIDEQVNKSVAAANRAATAARVAAVKAVQNRINGKFCDY